TEPTYTPSVKAQNYGVRALNEMGGLGEMVTVSATTGIEEAFSGETVKVRYYNMQGIEVRPGNEPTTLVKVTTFSNGTTRAEKVVE
ncbi:MAG: hypothetical protein K2L00_03160, partial [Muribaculaceae bacterium]|nr:hypothetical protein [Muribaculaceae bacterium]